MPDDLPPDGSPERWTVVKVYLSGSYDEVGPFGRFDLAQRYAQTLAESIAASDADARMRGVIESSVLGIVCGHDGWRIADMVDMYVALCVLCFPGAPSHRMYLPHRYGLARVTPRATLAVPEAIGYPHAGEQARRRLLLAYAQRAAR